MKKPVQKNLRKKVYSKPPPKLKNRAARKDGSFARNMTNSARLELHEDAVPYRINGNGHDAKLRFIDLFAGIGGIRLGLERAGAKCIFSSEWDHDAAQTYEAHFGEKPAGDITQIQSTTIPDHDILAGGFPCQAFSIIGGMKGFGDTRGTLFFEIERILRAKHPKAFLLENVRNLVSHDKGRTFKVILEHLRLLGYYVHWRILNALNYNLPQKRERVIVVGFKENHPFEWPRHQPLKRTLGSILEPDEAVNKKHFASEKVRLSVEARLVGKKLPPPPWICHENKAGNISPLPYSCALRAGASYNYLLVNGRRRLTSRENLRLQGFPEDFPIVVADSAIRKQCGNSVPVAMIEAVAKQIVTALTEKPLQINGTPLRIDAGQFEIQFPGLS
jgi:DNA (cytosine-5)-methyltransferase 1